MKKPFTKLFFRVFIFLIFLNFASNAQLIWSDEFNGTSVNTAIWNFDTGAGGWGNQELQYYRAENATVSGGLLNITAKRESFGGAAYTSSRMNSATKRNLTYGFLEARCKMPMGQGFWPAFWMIGYNIGSVGWPACGEIDIMEHVNAETRIVGSIHRTGANGEYILSNNEIHTTPGEWHNYQLEWTSSVMRWYVDGIQYHSVNIANSVNSTEEFHLPFFFVLNMAVGGVWPGAPTASTVFPAVYQVDYVRVYSQKPTTNTPPTVSLSAPLNNATFTAPATINIAANASDADGTVSKVDFYNGTTLIGTDATSPYSFSWTNVGTGTYTITARATDNAGLVTTSAPVNITVRTTPPASPVPGTIQAEAYSSMSGVQLETTTDTNGGQNVGWIEAGDWMDYLVNVSASGVYTVQYRVASLSGGGSIQLRSGTTNLATTTVPATGGWQTWTNVTATVNLTAGSQTLRLHAASGGFNVNWIQFTRSTTSTNLALNKAVSVSSTEGTTYAGARAVDGNATTRWSSSFANNQTFTVDLGASYNINRIKIAWEAAYASAYNIQVSANNSTWTTIKTVTGKTSAAADDHTGLASSARYVRINCTTRATVYGFSFWELEVYGVTAGRLANNEQISKPSFLYPNPAGKSVTLKIEESLLEGQITITSASGKVVKRESVKEIEQVLDLTDLPSGLYFVTIVNQADKKSYKLFKE